MRNTMFYPLTHPQQRIWYTEMMLPGTSFANIACSVRLKKGSVQLDLLKKAINLAVKYNDALRTRILPGDTEARQYVAEYRKLDLEIIQGPGLEAWLTKQSQTPFALNDADLCYFALLKYAEDSFGFYIKLHHVISDGFTFSILTKQIMEYYVELEQGKSAEKKTRPSFLDYFQREEAYLASEQCVRDREYWLQRLAHLPEPLNLQFSSAKSGITSTRRIFDMSTEVQQEIDQFCRRQDTTLFRFMMAVFYLYLSRAYAGNDLVIGTAYYNRVSRQELNTIGMYVSTMPVRITTDEQMRFSDLLNLIHQQLAADMVHQQYPYNLLAQDLRDAGQNPDGLINVNIVQIPHGKDDKYTVQACHQGADPAMLNMVINPNQLPKGAALQIALDYRNDIFSPADVERLYSHLCALIADILCDPQQKLFQLQIMPEEEKRLILERFNDSRLECLTDTTYQEMFAWAVNAYPDEPALVFEDKVYTYRELDAQTNKLARLLRAKGVKPDDRVAIMVSRSADIIVGALAIMKAGGAYLPIDPDYPADRILYMLADSGAQILLSQHHLKDKANGFQGEWLDLGDEDLYQGAETSIVSVNQPSDLAYVIYTSGSTGKPKGVMVEHRNLINLCCSHNTFYNLTHTDNGAAYFGFGFDGSVVSMFPLLVTGASLHIIPDDIRLNLHALNAYFEKHRITITILPTQLCEQFVEQIDNKSLKALITGGEKLKVYKQRDYRLVNEYGPTENTVDATAFFVDKPYVNIPIGKPRHNIWAYVVDKYGNPQPVGIPGELWVAGAQVARGYLNRPDLTEEKFIPNPFAVGAENARIYKTGDLVRWLPDGNLEFLGRIDMQVKIRGFRIELGEIESAILSFPGVTNTVVVDLPDANGNKYLCAYLVADDPVDIESLKQFIATDLPNYMVPTVFMEIPAIPFTPNGKVDRRALPQPDLAASQTEYVAPASEWQTAICHLWEEVLGVQRAGIKDDFFALGGTSIKAIALQSKIQQALGAQIAVGDIFSHPTPELLANFVQATARYFPIPLAPGADSYPLTPPQRQMYILRQTLSEETVYNIPAAYTVKGCLDRKRLEAAFHDLLKRHAALRTYFINVDGEPRQKVAEKVCLRLIYQESDRNKAGDVIAGYNNPFDLAEPFLFRAGLITVAKDEHVLFFIAHHIILDGLSIDVLIGELLALYNGQELPPVRIGYPDFAVWQQRNLAENTARQEKYWLELFADGVPVLELPADYPRPPVMNHAGAVVNQTVDEKLTMALNKLARENKTTLFTVLLTGYMALLARYAGKEDVVVGVPFAGRVHPDVERMVGMFVSTLPLRSRPDPQKTFSMLLAEVKEQATKAQENQDYPLETLVQKLGIRPDPSRNPLFDVVFNFLTRMEIKGDLDIEEYPGKIEISHFDFSLTIEETAHSLKAGFTYCTTLYSRKTMESMLHHYLVLLSAAVENVNVCLKDINLLSAAERKTLLHDFNDTYLPVPNKTIVDLFREQAKKAPDKIALVFQEKKVTYRELDRLTDRLAKHLTYMGAGREKAVGILVERSEIMVIAALGVLKSGAAYLPMDPAHPADRLEFMLEDAQAAALIMQPAFKHLTAGFSGGLLDITKLCELEDLADLSLTPPTPENLFILLYTSGSTGKPKGVMLEHRSIVNFCCWYCDYYQVTPADISAAYSSFGFDASMMDVYPLLISGATVHIIPEEMRLNLSGLNEYLEGNGITLTFMTTQLGRQFVENYANKSLRTLSVGGERFLPCRLPDHGFVNGYGPTECTIFTTTFTIDKEYPNMPIGKPLSNTWVYILDPYGNLQPVGVPGELCIAGVQVARGYLNRPELTEEKFVPNPYAVGPENARMYKSGDLARWLPDGNIEYMNRMDQQVKIRGFRIELGEIEQTILKFSGITDAVVVDLNDTVGGKYLCGYLTAAGTVCIEDLKQFISKELPYYMVPSAFMQIPAIPVNQNGKVNRRALPVPDLAAGKKEYIAPRNEMEEKIAAIWQEILGVERVGIDDDFFDLGGHSLKVSVLINKVNKAFRTRVAFQDVFNNPILQDFVVLVRNAEQMSLPPIIPNEKLPFYPLLAPQTKMLDFALKHAGNSPFPLQLNGKLNIERLWQALDTLVKRHETLRTSFDFIEGQPVQVVAEELMLEQKSRRLTPQEVEQALREFLRPFKLGEPPLWRVELWELASDRHILMFDIHHIISDGTSLGILMKELAAAYEGKELPPLEIQYRDYAIWQEKMLQSGGLKQMEEYWLQNLAGARSCLELPTDVPRQAVPDYEGESVGSELSAELTSQVYSLALQANTTTHVIIMSVYAILLAKYSGKRDITFEEGIAGRNYPEVENLFGMFVNIIPMRSLPQESKSFLKFLAEMNETLIRGYECQEYPVARLAEQLKIEIDPDLGSLQFDIGFVYQSMDIPEIRTADWEMKIYPLPASKTVARRELLLVIHEGQDTLLLNWVYRTSLFHRSTIEGMAKDFNSILTSVLANPDMKLETLL